MNLLKIIATPLQKLFSSPPPSKPTHELTPLGRQLFWEARKKQNLSKEQKQTKQ